MKTALRQTPVVYATLALCLIAYLITAMQSGSLESNFSGSQLAASWELFFPAVDATPSGILRGLGFSFIHSGLAHLFFNGLMLWILGTSIERTYGSATTATIIAATSFGSAAMIEFMDPVSITVGASGVIYGLMGVALGMSAGHRMQVQSLLVLIAVNLGFTLITPGISLWGHVGGLVTGLIIAAALYRIKNRQAQLMSVAIVAIACVCIFALRTSILNGM